jgi:hypothetical protein
MAKQPTQRCIIASYARDDAYLPLARVILARMGYSIVPCEQIDRILDLDDRRGPDLRIVDERRIGEVPDDPEGATVPMILLTGRHGVTGADPRVVGAVKRPAGLHEIYRLIQQVLEQNPRSTPRVPTNLPARCRRGDREWRASLISLSENGCLIRSPEPVPLGSELTLSFDLPRIGTIETRAESAYQLVPDLGLVFNGIPAASREAILSFVTRTLAAL